LSTVSSVFCFQGRSARTLAIQTLNSTAKWLTVLAVMLAMSYGFRGVTLMALASYLAAVLGMRASAT